MTTLSAPDKLNQAVAAESAEVLRPALHYTADTTWLNDPNGLIYHDGLYHLYYQNNPSGNAWGNMSWGHATSTDLCTWIQQPVAIACDDQADIFSGSIVFDRLNTSGFGTGQVAPLVAVYTSAFKPGSGLEGRQAQSLAYSLDGGYSWEKYRHNPVLDRESTDFRDPKVFRYDGDAGTYWVMVAVEALDYQAVLYRSDNLKDWELLSTFGPANATGGIWECPDLFALPVDGDEARTKWVLTVSLNPGGPNGGSAGQYFVGDFDGVTFTSESTVSEGQHEKSRLADFDWLDWGRDYYAAVTFGDVPDGRTLMMAWMSNWQYGHGIPAFPWRSAMALPREVSLRSVGGSLRLVQQPAAEVLALPAYGPVYSTGPVSISEESRLLDGAAGTVQRIDAVFTPGTAAEFGLIVRGKDGQGTRIGIRPRDGRLTVDRRSSGQTDFHETFASADVAPLAANSSSYELTVFVDECSVEIFAQDGQVTMTELIFPAEGSTEVSVYATGGAATATSLTVRQFA
ncbi:UNVERIFIED_ORG: levanase/fructan beta-fructosidase [Arthrobacter sp. UYEF13]